MNRLSVEIRGHSEFRGFPHYRVWAGAHPTGLNSRMRRVCTNFYRRFPGDYLRDTQHLTLSQHGIYCLLLDTLYATEKPIKSREDAYRIARCSEHDASIAECNAVIDEFFIESRAGIWHSKVENEVKYAESRRLTARTAAKVKWSKHAPSNAASMPPAYVEQCYPDSRLQTPEKEETNTQTPLVPVENCFQTFWKAYPIKINEAAAFRAWCKVPGIHDHLEEILTALMQYEISGLWDDRTKIPHAARFIQDRRWKDEIPKGGKREQQLERSIRESVDLAKEYGITENDLEMGHPPRPALQSPGIVPARRKDNLH